MEIRQARTAREIEWSRLLFKEYAAWLGIDLSFQGFEAELAGLPGVYRPPHGRLLLAFEANEASGCVALRPQKDGFCEMKRLFVRSNFRGQGFGIMLAKRIIEEARTIGYRTMKLDTLPRMKAAMRLYEILGFNRCPPYYETPLPDTIFMELRL